MQEQNNLIADELQPQAVYEIEGAANYGKIAGILGFISAGFSVISLIKVISGGFSGFGTITGQLLTVGFGVFMSFLLFKFGTETKKEMLSNGNLENSTGIRNLKMYFQIFGVLTIIGIVIMSLAIVVSIFFVLFKK